MEVQVDPNEPSRVVKIGKCLSNELVEQLLEFLKKNQDVFAWTHVEMIGIHPDVMCHQLNTDPQAKLVCQKGRTLDVDHYKSLQEEIDRLLRIGFIRESYYPIWLSNPVLVPKSNGKWRTCTDFTNLNKAFSKDNFSLPCIDQLLNATTEHEFDANWPKECMSDLLEIGESDVQRSNRKDHGSVDG